MDFLHSATEALSNSFSPSSKADQAALELRATLGQGPVVVVLGDAPPALAAQVAKSCSAQGDAVFVTQGQDTALHFADACRCEVYHLIATWDSTGFRGTDLAVGTDAGDCHALLAHLGDVFLAFETDPEVLQRAREHSKAILSIGCEEPGEKPWFVSEEQWKLITEPNTPAAKVASACAAALASFDAHHRAMAEPELCDELCYVDADAERWAQLAEAHQVPDVAKGQLRLEGNFQGTATTHTHQMDLNIGVNMEMPSKVAAKTMKQLSDAGLVPEQPRRGVLGALADYFRRDSQESPDVSSMILSGMQVKLEDVHRAYEAEQRELRTALEASRAEASEMASRAQALETELRRKEEELRAVRATEPEGLAQKAVAEATARDARRRVEDLEARCARLAAQEAEAKAEAQEARQQLASQLAEASQLRLEASELRERLGLVKRPQNGQELRSQAQVEELQRERREALEAKAALAAEAAQLAQEKEAHERRFAAASSESKALAEKVQELEKRLRERDAERAHELEDEALRLKEVRSQEQLAATGEEVVRAATEDLERPRPRSSLRTFTAYAPQAPRRTGKVTHIGTTTRMGNVSVFSPVKEGHGSAALPIGSFTQAVRTLPPSSASIHLPTAAGLVHGQIGIQVAGVRRIR